MTMKELKYVNEGLRVNYRGVNIYPGIQDNAI